MAGEGETSKGDTMILPKFEKDMEEHRHIWHSDMLKVQKLTEAEFGPGLSQDDSEQVQEGKIAECLPRIKAERDRLVQFRVDSFFDERMALLLMDIKYSHADMDEAGLRVEMSQKDQCDHFVQTALTFVKSGYDVSKMRESVVQGQGEEVARNIPLLNLAFGKGDEMRPLIDRVFGWASMELEVDRADLRKMWDKYNDVSEDSRSGFLSEINNVEGGYYVPMMLRNKEDGSVLPTGGDNKPNSAAFGKHRRREG